MRSVVPLIPVSLPWIWLSYAKLWILGFLWSFLYFSFLSYLSPWITLALSLSSCHSAYSCFLFLILFVFHHFQYPHFLDLLFFSQTYLVKIQNHMNSNMHLLLACPQYCWRKPQNRQWGRMKSLLICGHQLTWALNTVFKSDYISLGIIFPIILSAIKSQLFLPLTLISANDLSQQMISHAASQRKYTLSYKLSWLPIIKQNICQS